MPRTVLACVLSAPHCHPQPSCPLCSAAGCPPLRPGTSLLCWPSGLKPYLALRLFLLSPHHCPCVQRLPGSVPTLFSLSYQLLPSSPRASEHISLWSPDPQFSCSLDPRCLRHLGLHTCPEPDSPPIDHPSAPQTSSSWSSGRLLPDSTKCTPCLHLPSVPA